MLRIFRKMVYSRTRTQFEEVQEEFESCDVCGKYPNFEDYLMKTYGGRAEAWALFSRIERELPTHGSNTTAYAEISMRATKETQFGRMKTRNLAELLSVICDGSDLYKNKLIEVGNSRTSVLAKAGSKYAVPPSNVTKDQIADLGEGTFMVQSEVSEDMWYFCNMKSGLCTCARGVNSAPCRHKSSVSIHYNTAEFSVVPTDDPRQCALYHFIATGTTLEPHMYRKPGDIEIPDIKQYIEEKLKGAMVTEPKDIPNQSLLEEDSAISLVSQDEVLEEDMVMGEQDNFEDEEDERDNEEETKEVQRKFVAAMEQYTKQVLKLNTKDPANIKAMKAMTKTLLKSSNCNPHTLQSAMHNFGKGTDASRVSTWGKIIRPNAPSISAR